MGSRHEPTVDQLPAGEAEAERGKIEPHPVDTESRAALVDGARDQVGAVKVGQGVTEGPRGAPSGDDLKGGPPCGAFPPGGGRGTPSGTTAKQKKM